MLNFLYCRLFEVRERWWIGLNLVMLLTEFSYLFICLFNDAMPTACHYLYKVHETKETTVSCHCLLSQQWTLRYVSCGDVALCICQSIAVASRSKAWVCFRSLTGIAGSNPLRYGCLSLGKSCFVRKRFLRWADLSSREVMLSVISLECDRGTSWWRSSLLGAVALC
jgi:hypothetical protein